MFIFEEAESLVILEESVVDVNADIQEALEGFVDMLEQIIVIPDDDEQANQGGMWDGFAEEDESILDEDVVSGAEDTGAEDTGADILDGFDDVIDLVF